LEPALFMLAARATTAKGERVQIQIAAEGGSISYALEEETPTPAEARAYLEGLMRDYLSERSFEFLRLRTLSNSHRLLQAYTSPDGDEALKDLRASFCEELAEAIEEEDEAEAQSEAEPPLHDLVERRVPNDGFDLVRRRLTPIHHWYERNASDRDQAGV
jgi:hypothetical protein